MHLTGMRWVSYLKLGKGQCFCSAHWIVWERRGSLAAVFRAVLDAVTYARLQVALHEAVIFLCSFVFQIDLLPPRIGPMLFTVRCRTTVCFTTAASIGSYRRQEKRTKGRKDRLLASVSLLVIFTVRSTDHMPSIPARSASIEA